MSLPLPFSLSAIDAVDIEQATAAMLTIDRLARDCPDVASIDAQLREQLTADEYQEFRVNWAKTYVFLETAASRAEASRSKALDRFVDHLAAP
jgi:hypothetical protein